MSKKITICKPNGFCAGVKRAIKIVELALEAYGPPIYVNHEIVHNQHVCRRLAAMGAVFVEDLNQVPEGARLIYSAHGVSPQLRQQAKDQKLKELDATCPLVTKVHLEAMRFARQGFHIFLIGHASHVEVIGTLGEAPDAITVVEPKSGAALEQAIAQLPQPPTEKLAYLTQTTLNVDDCAQVVAALKKRFPHLTGPPKDDICYATTNRQDAVKALAPDVDYFIVVGSPSSSNSKRLVEVAKTAGCRAGLFHQLDDLFALDLRQVAHIGITAGASTPDDVAGQMLAYLVSMGYEEVETYDHVEEHMEFKLPSQLKRDVEAKHMAV